MTYFKSFLAGFFSTLTFHQGLLALFSFVAKSPLGAYNTAPTEPLGVPAVLSTSFFAGLWGIVIWKLIERRSKKFQLIASVILGAIFPTLVAFAVVFPLKGVEFKSEYIPVGLILNGAWGFGLWFYIQLINKSSPLKISP